MKDERIKEDEMLDVLRMVAPGTPLREGLENILRARTGALIVIGDSSEVMSLVDGGFEVNNDYSPYYLYELSKMDGAIVISKDLKRFLYANALLVPNHTIYTSETGTRHKTAERVAKQINEVVICISQRRNLISIYKGNRKHVLRETSSIISRASQALQTLEKYKSVLDTSVNNLSVLEFEDVVTLYDVGNVLQRSEMVVRILEEIQRYITELGNEGRLLSMQLEELTGNVEEDEKLIIEDYLPEGKGEDYSETVLRNLRNLSGEGLMDLALICRNLGYPVTASNLDTAVVPRGYRILNKVPRLPATVVKNMIQKFQNFQGIVNASVELLDDVEGIGEIRAKAIQDGIKRIHEQIIWENLRK